jgi:hypothetical protein
MASASAPTKPAGSGYGTLSSLDIFENLALHTAIERGHWRTVLPIRLGENEPIEFSVPASDANYDPYETYVRFDAKVTKADGSALSDTIADIEVIPGDNFMPSLFKKITYLVNNTTVEYEPNLPFRSYLETLVYKSKDAKETLLPTSRGWFQDANRGKDHDGLNAEVTAARKELIKGSRVFSFFEKVPLSCFESDRMLPADTSFQLHFERDSPQKALMSLTATPEGGALISIVKAELHVRAVHVANGVHKGHKAKLTRGVTAKYPQRRIQSSVHSISQGIHDTKIKVEVDGPKPL